MEAGNLNKPAATTDKEVFITRTFNAPIEMVYKAWKNEKQLAQWYAPDGCDIKLLKLDFRPGGIFHHYIQAPDGFQCWVIGVYQEIIPNKKIVYTLAFSDKEGNVLKEVPFEKHPKWPLETTVTVWFEEVNGKTTITLHQTVSEELAKQTGAYPSWLSMLDRLEKIMAS